jgi:hypothetical protein
MEEFGASRRREGLEAWRPAPSSKITLDPRYADGALRVVRARVASRRLGRVGRRKGSELAVGRSTMTEGSGAKDASRTPNDEERASGNDVLAGLGELERRVTLDWVGEHLPEVRRSAYGQRSLYWTLGVGFIVGLAAYVGGYALRSSVTTEPLGFVADLLYTLGWALWTGVVVVVFLQILPEAAASIQGGARSL